MNNDPVALSPTVQRHGLPAAPVSASAVFDIYTLLLDAVRVIVTAPDYAAAMQRAVAYLCDKCQLAQLVVEMQEGDAFRRDTFCELSDSDAASVLPHAPARRVVVPLISSERKGSITFVFMPDAPHIPRDVLETLAGSLGLRLADENMRRRAQEAEQKAARRLRDVAAQADVGQALTRVPSEQTLQRIVERAARLMEAQTCSLLLLDARQQNLHIAASYGLTPDARVQKQLLGDSIAGRVAQTQQPLLIGKSVPRDARLGGIKLRSELGSAMLTPLLDQQNCVLGVLCVRRPSDKPEFTVDEAHLFGAFATQATLALVNTRLIEDLNRRADDLLKIAALSRSLLSSIDLDAALQTTLQEVCDVVGCDRCCLYLREPDRPVFTPRLLHGYPNHIGRNPVKMGEGAVGLAARTRQPLCFDSALPVPPEAAQELPYRQMKGYARSLGTNAFAALPLLTSRDACIGVLVADNKLRRGPVTRDQMNLLQAFASQAGIALENARLSEQMQDSAASLRGLKDYTDNVLQSIEAAIVTTDGRGHLARCNRAAEETFQRPARALRDVPLADALAYLRLPPDEAEHLLKLVRHVQETGEPVHRLKLTLHPQERPPATVYLMVSRLPDHKPVKNDGGKPMRSGVVIIFEDVTQEVRLEAELEKMRRLADIGQLAAKMAHEVRNALSPIKGAAQIIRSDMQSEEERKQEKESRRKGKGGNAVTSGLLHADSAAHAEPEFLDDGAGNAEPDVRAANTEWPDMIIAEVDGLSRLTSEMLDFARPTPLDPRPVALNIFLRTSVQALAYFLEEHGVRLQWRLDPDAALVQADPAQLGQVVRNLVMNAAQAMPEGGTLTLHSALDRARGEIALRFEDTGVGIPEADVERIFRPFVTTRPKGTGLGLPIVQKIVDHHGGRVEVKSQVGQGTCFTVWLPLTPPQSRFDGGFWREEESTAHIRPEGALTYEGDEGTLPDN